MEAIPFIGSNKELSPPKDAGHKALPLPVLTDGKDWVSCWQLDSSEIERISETGRIWLRVRSKNHPWVSISVNEPEFGDE